MPKVTLKRHLEGKNNFAVEGNKMIGSLGDLPPEIEKELVVHILKLEMFLELQPKTYENSRSKSLNKITSNTDSAKRRDRLRKNVTTILCGDIPN